MEILGWVALGAMWVVPLVAGTIGNYERTMYAQLLVMLVTIVGLAVFVIADHY